MKTIAKITLLMIFSVLMLGCCKDDPVTPRFSKSVVTIKVGETDEVVTRDGTPGYTVTSSNTLVARATVTGNLRF